MGLRACICKVAECELNSVLIDLTASALATKLDYLLPKIKK